MRYVPFARKVRIFAGEFGHFEPLQFVNEDSLRAQIHRGRFFQDGVELLMNFGHNDVPLEVTFIGEPAVGIGPTQEFFDLFSGELRQRMFRKADDSQGLFPAPDASPKEVELLGFLLARTLLAETHVDLQLNENFFTLMRESFDPGRTEERLASIDQELYFGLRLMEEEEGKDYMSAVCGVKFREAMREPFVRGFNYVFPFEAFASLFTDEEIGSIFSGCCNIFTEEDLRTGIRPMQGYTHASREIQMCKTSFVK
jgi:hypothetical protein